MGDFGCLGGSVIRSSSSVLSVWIGGSGAAAAVSARATSARLPMSNRLLLTIPNLYSIPRVGKYETIAHMSESPIVHWRHSEDGLSAPPMARRPVSNLLAQYT